MLKDIALRINPILILICGLLVVLGCTKNEEKIAEVAPPETLLTPEDVDSIFAYYAERNFPAYASHFYIAQIQQATYRNQLVTMLKQHADEMQREYGNIKQYSIDKIIDSSVGNSAEAFVKVVYEHGDTEEISLHFINDNGVWMIR